MEYVNNYVLLQQIRFEDAFILNNEIAEELAGCTVPRLTIQPFIENAIYHGLSDCVKGGEITITAEKNKDMLIIRIVDNGKGMDAQQLQNLQKRLALCTCEEMPFQHIGILNVSIRLRTMYGPKGKVRIIKSDSLGTIIELTVPQER